MARRYRRRGGRYSGKRRWRNYRRGLGQLWHDVKYLKGIVNVERKALDIQADANPSNIATIVTLSSVAQGDDYNQRNGRKIKAQSIFLNGQVKINSSASETTMRVIIFWDKDSDGETATASELLQDGGDLQSPLNYANAGSRFKVIYDRNFSLSSNGPQIKNVYCYRRLYHHITYLGTGSTSGNNGTGTLFMLLMSNEPTNTPTFNYWARFRYTDN